MLKLARKVGFVDNCSFLLLNRLNMPSAHIEMPFLSIEELHGATLGIMCISILDSKLYGLGADVFSITVQLLTCPPSLPRHKHMHFYLVYSAKAFQMKLICFRWYASLEMYDLAVTHMLEVLACSHQSKTTQDIFLRDFLQIVQVMWVLVIFFYALKRSAQKFQVCGS